MSRKRVLSESQYRAAELMALALERISTGTRNVYRDFDSVEDVRGFIGILGGIARDALWKYDQASNESILH